jgi:microsomal dipeptidase-like Zn-dependent dipeptidase
MKKFYILILFFFIYTLLHIYLPEYLLTSYNKVKLPYPYKSSARATEIYRNLPYTVDLHSDALLWGTDLNRTHKGGMVNIPWLRESRPHLQIFTIVTKVPKKLGYNANSSTGDKLTLPFILSGRDPATWFSLRNRVLEQIRRLDSYAEQSGGFLQVIRSKKDLENFINHIDKGEKHTGGIIGIEGLHCLEGDPENLLLFWKRGVRMASPLHLFDNELGGSGQGKKKGGLTEFGKEIVRKMDSLGMIIDLAHASEQTVDDILQLTTGPVVTSHTGAKGICNNNRNLSDKHLKAIAERGGIIGVAFFKPAMCKTDYAQTARTIRYIADLVGTEYVCLGSDFDGAVSTPTDIRGLNLLVDELLKKGFYPREIRMITGENAMRFWLEHLP